MHPDMLFGAKNLWWGMRAKRGSAHEGLDLALFSDLSGNIRPLGPGTIVPSVGEGRVVRIMDDFLGKTVVVAEEIAGCALYMLYAHIAPANGLLVGKELMPGAPVGSIADPGKKSRKAPAHLHISVGRADLLPPASVLDWDILNSMGPDRFLDPVLLLENRYRVVEPLLM